MQTALRSLLASVRQHLGDAQWWSVLADWLTEHGDARGQLIALDLQLDDPATARDTRRDLRRRITAIELEHRGAWRAGLPVPVGAQLQWRWGFVVGARLPWGGDALGALAALRAHPAAGLLSALAFSEVHLGDDGAAALAASTALAGLATLDLSDHEMGADGVAMLASADALSGLRTLVLSDNLINDEGAKAIARSAALTELTTLKLHRTWIGPAGVQALALPRSRTSPRSICPATGSAPHASTPSPRPRRSRAWRRSTSRTTSSTARTARASCPRAR